MSKKAERFKSDKVLKVDKIDSIDESGVEVNAPPLEMTEDVIAELLSEEEKKDERIKEVRETTQHYLNGKNEWKLISKSYNNVLGWSNTTMAMQVGNSGILVCLKEGLNNQLSSTMTFIPGGKLIEAGDKFIIE